MMVANLWEALSRKQQIGTDVMKTPLKRCLNTIHLTLFGIGHMAGAGVFTVTGVVAKTHSGPATFVSYIIAGFIAILAALCYAEFGSSVPKAGSSYSYAYVTVGEGIAFIIGWNLLLEHCISVAAEARAWSGTLDIITGGKIKNLTIEMLGHFESPYMAEYVDFVGPLVIILVTIFVASGAEISMIFNGVLVVIIFIFSIVVVISSVSVVDVNNWTLKPGGFTPFGMEGVLSGAAICMYTYVGFDGISAAGEEAVNPAKSIPIASVLSVAVVAVLYVTLSIILTLLVPYYDIDTTSPFTAAFNQIGIRWVSIFVSVTTLIAILGPMVASMYVVPRLSYAMASDGLLFSPLARVNSKTNVPLISLFVFFVISSIACVLFDVKSLADFISTGTLLATAVVSVCVIILRYSPDDTDITDNEYVNLDELNESEGSTHTEQQGLTADDAKTSVLKSNVGRSSQKFKKFKVLDKFEAGNVVKIAAIIMTLFQIFVGSLVSYGSRYILHGHWWAIMLLVFGITGIVITLLAISIHEQRKCISGKFRMPLVPYLPAVALFFDIIMLLNVNPMAWVRFGLWMAIGVIIYLTYGMHNSKAKRQPLSQCETNYSSIEK